MFYLSAISYSSIRKLNTIRNRSYIDFLNDWEVSIDTEFAKRIEILGFNRRKNNPIIINFFKGDDEKLLKRELGSFQIPQRKENEEWKKKSAKKLYKNKNVFKIKFRGHGEFFC